MRIPRILAFKLVSASLQGGKPATQNLGDGAMRRRIRDDRRPGAAYPGRMLVSMTLTRRHTLLALLLAAGCGDGNTDATTGDTSTGTASTSTATSPTSSGSTAMSDTAGSTTGAPTTSESSSTSVETMTSVGDTSSESGSESGDACAPTDLPRCPVRRCLEEWSYSCRDCGDFFDFKTCFEIDVGCTYPALVCDLPSPCDRVWGQGYDTIEQIEDEDAAICLLTALRDGTPGKFELLWGEMGDAPLVYMDVYSANGRVFLEWYLECQGCPNSGYFKRSGQLALQPQSFFDDCLAAPTSDSLIQCVFGFVDFEPESPPPVDYFPPWTTADCLSLEIMCPG